jgi:predicted enzyme related to lactoylglutathione lyase
LLIVENKFTYKQTLNIDNMGKMNPVVHFEMPAKDRNRMAEFYTKTFGWQANFMGVEMGNYVTVSTTETDEKGMPKNPGAINGGFYPLVKDSPEYPSVVIAVDDINESIKKVTAAGGKIEGDVMPIPGIGKWVAFIDTEGNRVSMLQPDMSAQQ